MKKDPLVQVILDRINELTTWVEEYRATADNYAIQIAALRDILEEIEEKDKELKREVVSNNIKKNTLKTLLPDERDAKRVNIFLEFLDKVGEPPSSFIQAREKMSKLETAIYRNRLWSGWPAFKEDYRRWLNREEPWTGVLGRRENGETGEHE